MGFKLPVGGAKTKCTHTIQLQVQALRTYVWPHHNIIPLFTGPVSDDESEVPGFSEDHYRVTATDERPSRAADTSGEHCHV